jgi:hypothetical protein
MAEDIHSFLGPNLLAPLADLQHDFSTLELTIYLLVSSPTRKGTSSTVVPKVSLKETQRRGAAYVVWG